MEPLRNHEPPILEPEGRLNAFIAEVFSSIQTIYESHSRLLAQLAERQRNEWPLVSFAHDHNFRLRPGLNVCSSLLLPIYFLAYFWS